MKIKMLNYIDESKRNAIKNIARDKGKTMSSLVEEGMDAVINKYSGAPRTLREALDRTYGLCEGKKIRNIRDEMNKNLLKRSRAL